MATAADLTAAKNNALNPTRTVYASGTDLANAKSVYGNTVNYGDINNASGLKSGDLVIGGSAVTPNISDSAISGAGATRLYGNTANDTLAQMQGNARTTLPQYYQNVNNSALANTNYDTLNLNDISSGYKDTLNNALSNANANTSLYQGKVSDALNNYQNAYTVNPEDSTTFKNDMTNSINNLYDTEKNNVGLYYQTGINQAKQQYAGLRDQASVGQQQNLNKLKETIAQQGLFNSGDNLTQQGNINNQYQNDITGYNKQEQNYYDTTNNQIAQQKAAYDAQAAQALIDLGYKADDRDFNLANLYDTRNQNTFNNSMTGINSMYGMSQDQYNNILKSVAQEYGMDEDQVQNLLNYANYNTNQDQRQFTNTTTANKYNSDLTQAQTDNSYRQAQADISNKQAQQQIDNQQNQWQQQFDYQKQQDALAQQLAAAKASSGGSGSGGGRRSSGSSSKKSSSSSNKYYSSDYANDAKALADAGYSSSFIKASMPTWDYESLASENNGMPYYTQSR